MGLGSHHNQPQPQPHLKPTNNLPSPPPSPLQEAQEELEAFLGEMRSDYNQRHFVRNETFKVGGGVIWAQGGKMQAEVAFQGIALQGVQRQEGPHVTEQHLVCARLQLPLGSRPTPGAAHQQSAVHVLISICLSWPLPLYPTPHTHPIHTPRWLPTS
jgi:hypothetical protein